MAVRSAEYVHWVPYLGRLAAAVSGGATNLGCGACGGGVGAVDGAGVLMRGGLLLRCFMEPIWRAGIIPPEQLIDGRGGPEH